MTSKELLELAARCEEAAGPDRLLDGAVSGKTQPDGAVWQGTPRYTASLDAAMSLIRDPKKPWGVYHFQANHMAFVEVFIGKAATPALALTAAALRARAAMEADHAK